MCIRDRYLCVFQIIYSRSRAGVVGVRVDIQKRFFAKSRFQSTRNDITGQTGSLREVGRDDRSIERYGPAGECAGSRCYRITR